MHLRSPEPSSHPRARRSRSPRLALLLSLLAVLIGSFATAGAQCLVPNPSFETFVTTSINTPGYSWAPTSMQPIPGLTSWFSGRQYPTNIGGGSPDLFWPSAYVPLNYMTTPTTPRTAFDGKNYAGIYCERVNSSFRSEIISARLLGSPTGSPYEVRARFAMGGAFNRPSYIRVSLTGPTGNVYVVGQQLINNTNWNLFSQIINLPASPAFDRIIIEAVDLIPTNYRAFCFIDSVDICKANPCDYMTANVKQKIGPTGQKTCCFDLWIDNNTPTTFTQPYYVRVTTLLPVVITGPSANTGGNWQMTSVTTTAVTWGKVPTGSPIPIGSGQYVGSYCINNNGVNPHQQIVEFLDKQGKVLCKKVFYFSCEEIIHLPPCPELGHVTVTCDSMTSTGQAYHVSFTFVPVGPWPAGAYFLFSSAQGSVTPSYAFPGAGPLTVNVTLIDTGAVDSIACIYWQYRVKTVNYDTMICDGKFCFELPHCVKPCCKDFLKNISYSMLVLNGTVYFNGCALAGPGQIKRFSASVISAQTRSFCPVASGWNRAFGDITSATIGGGILPVSYVPAPYGREAVFGGPDYPYCYSFNPCRPFTLRMQFPNPPANGHCYDSLMFCIRFSFTDCNCVTCDTVICFKVKRKYTFLPWLSDPVSFDPVDATPVLKPDGSLLSMSMRNANTGTLSVTLPTAADDEPAIRVTGMSVRPLTVPITGLTEQGSGTSATITGNTASIRLSLNGGGTDAFAVSYANSENLETLDNYVRFRYVIIGDPDGTEYETDDILVQGVNPRFAGGDNVSEESEPPVRNVRTYALHVDADNALGNDVRGIRVTVNSDLSRLIAVGPVGNGTSAVLVPGEDGDGNSVVQVSPDTWQIERVSAGGALAPVYLTFSEAASGVEVTYETLNDNGTVLTSGSVTLGSPLRAAGTGSDVAADRSEALYPIYPNPSGSSATVSFQMADQAKVSLSIRDMNGREVARRIDAQRLDGGTHVLALKTADLAQGAYMVVLEIDGRIYSRTLQVVR